MTKQEKGRYTAEERRAYYIGVGACMGYGRNGAIHKTLKEMTPAEKKSFYNGFDHYTRKRNWRGKTR